MPWRRAGYELAAETPDAAAEELDVGGPHRASAMGCPEAWQPGSMDAYREMSLHRWSRVPDSRAMPAPRNDVAQRLPGLAALLHEVAELLDVGRAGEICDALVGRVHLGAERREIRARHLHAGRLELLDLVR